MRLFIAALFPEDTIGELKGLRENLRRSSESGSFVPDSNLHLTLAFLGECNEKQKDDAVSAIKRLHDFSVPVDINRMGYFSRDDGKLWFAQLEDSEALTGLHDELQDNLKELGLPFDGKRFRPHITLARRVRGDMKPGRIPRMHSQIVSVDLMLSERINGRMVYTSLYSREALSNG